MANNNMKQNPRSQRKKYKTTNEKRALTKRIIVAVLIGLALMYGVFLFVTTNFMGNNNYVTEMITKTSTANTIKSDALIIRDEVLLDNNSDGTIVYSVGNGEKVRTKSTIASVFPNESDAINKQKINDIDEKIVYLKTLADDNTSVNVGVDTMNDQVNNQLIKFIDVVNKGNFANVPKVQDELMSMIYRKQIITGEQGSFDKIIQNLESEKAELEANTSNPIESIVAGQAGYFVTNLDGYEKTFSLEDLQKITYDQYKNTAPVEFDSNDYIGKIIKTVNWYIVCPITKDDKTMIELNDEELYVKLPFAFSEQMPAKVVCANETEGEDTVMLVLSCNYMNESIAEIRKESVDILVSSYEGLKVPKKALHDDYCTKTTYNDDGTTNEIKEKAQGVYVEFGNQLKFKPVYITYSGDDYVICSETPNSESAYDQKTVTLYDNVVVEGSDLYDGKLLD